MKKILAILLVITILCALALPAVASENSSFCPYTPIIFVQPRGGHFNGWRATGILSVQARTLGGHALTFRWYRDGQFVGSLLGNMHLISTHAGYYHVRVHNREFPQYYATSQTVRVNIYLLLADRLMIRLGHSFVNRGWDSWYTPTYILTMPLRWLEMGVRRLFGRGGRR